MASLSPQSPCVGRSRSSASRSDGITPQADSLPDSQTDGASEQPETLFPAPSTASRSIRSEPEQQQTEEDANRAIQAATPPDSPANPEPKKCWICYTDETEDSPLNTEWRSPCPCALTAHEACLLDWLADLENPKSRKRNGRQAKLLCPQCKAEIVISRPRSFIVDLVRSMERLAGRLVLPGMVFTLAGTVWAGCCAHGVYSLYFVFGSEDAQRIFDSGTTATWNPRLNLGLPLIPIVLIFSRTRYAEGLLPAIPVLFFATHHPGAHELDIDLWPPSASITFAALPYAKSFYSLLYERLFGKLERRWISEVQPRSGSDNNEEVQGRQGDNRQEGGLEAENGGVLMEIDLELQVGMDHDIANDQQDDIPQFLGGDDQQQAGEGENGGEGQAEGNLADRQGNQILGRRRDELIHDSSNLADTVLGALLFPAISASMGGLLKYALPKAWTTAPSTLEKGRAGLLQSKWGRSVVGGCLFVLLKDALVLYCRWKLAQTHRKRRVLNYNRAKKQVIR